MVWSPSAVSVASMTVRRLVRARPGHGHHQQPPRGLTRLHAPGAFPSAGMKGKRYPPPRRRSPSTSPSQRARRRGSVSADHRSSISVSKRSSMRTTPLPSADPRLPRMRPLPLMHCSSSACSFVRVSPAPPRCAGHPAAAPTRPDTGPAIHRSRRAARGEDCRPAAAPPGGPRRAPPPAARADAAIPLDERSAAAPPTHPRLPGRRPRSPAPCAGSRPPVPAAQLP